MENHRLSPLKYGTKQKAKKLAAAKPKIANTLIVIPSK